MAEKAILFDTTKCMACRACQVACKQWNKLPAVVTTNSGTYENPPQLNAYTFTKLRFTEYSDNGKLQWVFTKVQCMHCEHPACATACPVGALTKTEEGPVIYDDNKCIGCRYCMVACPFGIPNFEWDKPMPWIRKCTFCEGRLVQGLKPACATTCPTGALQFGNRDELIAEAKKRITAQPQLYINHIYGEKEVGGTSWMYISSVPFEKLGFPVLGSTPVTVNVQRAMGAVPPALILVAAGMSGVYWLVKRRQAASQHIAGKQVAEREVKK
jgi:formate dehydrogenase iron-sulfur subunit